MPIFRFSTATNSGVWGQVADAIRLAIFYLNRFKGYAPRGGGNLSYSTDLMYRPDSTATSIGKSEAEV